MPRILVLIIPVILIVAAVLLQIRLAKKKHKKVLNRDDIITLFEGTLEWNIMEDSLMKFEVKESSDTKTIKELFVEYSHIKGAESCFVSFDKELNDLAGYYSGGAILVGYEEDTPVACVAVRKISDTTCEGKRLFIKPEYRGKGYARIMIKAMTDKASALGFKEVVFTTKPEVMNVGYGLYKRMGFEELSEENGIVSMRIDLSRMN